jgi:hypothetical protein
MQAPAQDSRGHDRIIALLTGSPIGAGPEFWLAPRVSPPFRVRVAGSATRLASARLISTRR